MKEKVTAIIIFILIIGFVITNSILLQNITSMLTEEISNLAVDSEGALEEITKIDKSFKSKENYIGLTVSHDDLTNIEDCFAELTGYLSVGDSDGAEVTKHRLIRFLEHLRRLVGFNVDTII